MPASDLTPIQPPTEREIMDAFKSLKTIATMFKAIGKFRASKRRSRTSQVTDDVSESLGSSPSGTSRPGSPSSYTDQLVDSPLSSLTFSPRPRAPSIRTRTAPDLASPLRKLTFDTARQPTPLARADPLLTPAHLPSLDQALESFHLAASPVFKIKIFVDHISVS
ncbi:hypothetical protein PtB15_1B618 [Puccinia triticina]|nr:hypothetical protein PtB15_1B618 [Puccinia triticina]